MSRLHSTLIALVLGSVAAAGLFAGVKTVRLGQKVSAATHPVAARELALRQAKLDRWSRSLRAQQAKRPPALPRVPKFAPVSARQAAAPEASPVAPAASPVTPPVTYVRPKPVVEYQRAAGKSTTATSTQQSSSDDDGTTESSDSSDDGGSTSEGD
jgi:hypothetical protein